MAMSRSRVRKVFFRLTRKHNAAENIDELEGWMVGSPAESKK